MIVGLGNPGKRYARTPHNAGFAVIDALAGRMRLALRKSWRFDSVIGEGILGEEKVILVQPQKFMNLSGTAVAAIARRKGVAPGDILVILDDAALPEGELRIRGRGSSGGHKGLQSIMDCLGSQEMIRIRIGIGRGLDDRSLKDHVLTRLSDAEFFYKQDQKATLESRLPKLSQVVYHNKLGNQAERLNRLMSISGAIAKALGADAAVAERATRLSKADLVTEMVGEFPELQGTMGKYYARLDGESEEIANAIEQHYRPRFAGDDLPEGKTATAAALADKLETLIGIWGIGLIPTGDKDPYALRRSALGILRMLMNSDLSISEVLKTAYATFPAGKLADNTVAEVADFMQARLAVLLQNDYPQDIVAAVLAQQPDRLNDLTAKLQAVAAFKQLPEAAALAAANKRVQNLLKKADAELGAVNESLLQQAEEQALFAAAQALQPKIAAAVAGNDFQTALTELAAIKPQVDAFFDGVMVMADDAAVKQNRLNLLNQLAGQMNAVADISRLGE